MALDLLDFTGLWEFTDVEVTPPTPVVEPDITVSQPPVNPAQYRFVLMNERGETLGDFDTVIQSDIALVENDVSVVDITIPNVYPSSWFAVDNRIAIYRTAYGRTYLVGKTHWLIRTVTYELTENNMWLVSITAHSMLSVLKRRIIPYNSGNSYTLKLAPSDNMIKAVVRENLGSLATDTTRNLSAYLTIDADASAGQSLLMEISKDNVLSAIQEISNASYNLGTWVGFSLDSNEDAAHTYIFRTHILTSDVDHRWPGGDAPILVGVNYGNFTNAKVTIDYENEANYIYYAGPGEESMRAVYTVSDSSRVGAGPFARVEKFISDTEAYDPQRLISGANAALIAAGPRIEISGEMVDTPAVRYGIDFELGSLITIGIGSLLYDCRLEKVHISISESGEKISPEFRSL